MIEVTFVRSGLHVLAWTKNDNNTIFAGMGFTRNGALRHLEKSMERRNKRRRS